MRVNNSGPKIVFGAFLSFSFCLASFLLSTRQLGGFKGHFRFKVTPKQPDKLTKDVSLKIFEDFRRLLKVT